MRHGLVVLNPPVSDPTASVCCPLKHLASEVCCPLKHLASEVCCPLKHLASEVSTSDLAPARPRASFRVPLFLGGVKCGTGWLASTSAVPDTTASVWCPLKHLASVSTSLSRTAAASFAGPPPSGVPLQSAWCVLF